MELIKPDRAFLVIPLIFLGITMPVHAENEYTGLPVIPSDATGSLTIRYFDDSYETIPAAGAEFSVYKVADISAGYAAVIPDDDTLAVIENGMNISIFNDIVINGQTDPADIAEEVQKKYAEGVPENGAFFAGEIGYDGLLSFEDMPVGSYLVVEAQAIHYHIATSPFFVSVPETVHDEESGLSWWNFDVVAEPKVNLAGSVVVEKTLAGSGSSKEDIFSFRVSIAEGEYECLMPDGSVSMIHDQDIIRMKGGQHFSIVDLPAGTDYEVIEIEANKNGYTTTYKNNKGTVLAKNVWKAEVKNSKDDVHTGIYEDPRYLIGLAAAAIAGILLIVTKKKKGEKNQYE